MKTTKTLKTSVKVTALALALAVGFTVWAAEEAVTVKGEGKCAKCALKEKDACQNVIVEEKDGKKTTYYLTANDVSKAFHKNICADTKKVKAVGTVKTVDGKKELTVTKIELDK